MPEEIDMTMTGRASNTVKKDEKRKNRSNRKEPMEIRDQEI